MGYCRQLALPAAEPVTLAMVQSFLYLPPGNTSQDTFLTLAIQAAREEGEKLTWRSLAQRQFIQVLDSMPYYTDTIQSQLAYPPNYYSLPRYSTTLWNYSQMIKLGYSPCISVQYMQYIDQNGSAQQLMQDVDFVLDRVSEPSRIFPLPGSYWPPNLYVANSCEIVYTAGYDPNQAAIDTHTIAASPPFQQPSSTLVTGVPAKVLLASLNLISYWFNNRGALGTVPDSLAMAFLSEAVIDFAPTRG